MNIIRVNKTAQSWYPHAVPFLGRNVMKHITKGKNGVSFALPGRHSKPANQHIEKFPNTALKEKK